MSFHSIHSLIGSNNQFRGATVFGNTYSSEGGVKGIVKGIQIKSNGTFIIDGKEYKSDELEVRTEYKIKATGETVYTEPDHLLLKIQGDNITVSASSQSGNLQIDCEKPCTFRSLNTQSGNIDVRGDAERINTMSGDVSVDGSVSGDVSTMSGNIRSRNK